MQSHNGDIELNVTLNTKGVESDAKKIKKEIENATKDKVGTYVAYDKEQIEKEVQAMVDNVNKSLEDNEIDITPKVDKEEALKRFADTVKEFQEYNKQLVEQQNAKIFKGGREEWEEYKALHKTSEAVDAVKESVKELNTAIDETFNDASTDEYIASLDEIKNRVAALYENYDKGSAASYIVNDQIRYIQEEVGQLSEEEQDAFDQWFDDLQRTRRAAEELKKAQEQVAESSESSTSKANTEKYVSAIKDAQAQLKSLANDYLIMKEGFHYSEDFVRLKKDAESLTKELNNVNEKLHKMELEGTDNTDKYTKMAEKANNLSMVLRNILIDMNTMRDDDSAFEEGIDPEQLQQVEKLYDTLASKMALIQTESQNVGEQTGDMTDEFSMAGDAAGAFGGHIGMVINIATKAIGIFKKVGSAIKQVGNFLNKTLITPIKKLANQVTKLLNPVKSLQKVTLSFRQVLGHALGIKGLFGVFSKLRSYITEGTQNLAKWRDGNNRANESLSTLISTLQWMKNAWGAAFEPILTYVTPLLDTLISKVAETANAISFMLAKLTGQSTWMKAIRVQKDYAKSLSGTGGAAKDATQKLAQYDKLVVINQDNASGASNANVDIDKMFEEVPIDDAIDWADNILDKLLEAWKKADFSDIGKLIGTWLKECLDNIDWASIKQWASKIAKSLATLLNGFFETEGLGTSIGKSLAEAFNTAFAFLDDFVHTLHWKSIGKFISETLLGFLDTFDATTAGSAIGGLIRGFIDMIYTALDDFAENEGFEKIGQKIAEFITAGLKELSYVDLSEGGTGLTGWEEMGESITIAVHGLMTTISTAIQDLTDEGVFEELGRGIAQLLDKIDFTQFITDTGDLVKNIMEALSQALQGFTGTDNIADAIVKLIEDSVKNITVTIAKIVFKITEIAFEESVPETISSVFNKMAGELTALHIVLGIVSSPLNNVLSVIESLIHAMGNLNMLLKASPVLWQIIKKEAQSFWDGLSLYVEDIKFWLSDLWDNYLKPFSYWVIEELMPGLFMAVSANLVLIAYDIAQFLIALDTVKDSIKDTINSIIPIIEDFFNGIIKGINDLFSSIGTIDIEVPDWAKKVGLDDLKFDLPTIKTVSIPRLAQGAVIPPNKEFLAMLGDQNQGVNIETPLETMMEAFRAVLAENGSTNNEPIVLQLNGKVIAQAVWDEERKKYKQTGSYAY